MMNSPNRPSFTMLEGAGFLIAFGFLCASAVAALPQTWCVQPDVAEIGERPNAMCKSLDYYVENQTAYFTSDARVVFLPGTHELSGALVIAGVSNLSFSCDSCTADVHCRDEQNGVVFVQSKNITIKNINFISCGAITSHDAGSPFRFAALHFWEVATITIDNVGLVNSRGNGVVATRMSGENVIKHSTFCRSIGSNARFSFKKCLPAAKTSLQIESTEFSGGKSNASGLLIESSCHGMNIRLDSVTASGNDGGNIQVKMEARQWKVVVFNSTITNGSGNEGSGLHLLTRTSDDHQCCGNVSSDGGSTGNSIQIVDTVFSFNAARKCGGGLLAELYNTDEQSELTLQNCTFRGNLVTSSDDGQGAALKIFSYPNIQRLTRSSSLLPSYRVHIAESQFCNNSINRVGPSASVVEFENVAMASLANTIFNNNRGTAIAMMSSNILFKGSVQFSNNRGTYGGALRFCALSTMFLNKDTSVLFRDNHAYKMGGAIYVEEACLEQLKTCFFQPNVKDGSLVTDLSTQYHVNLTFAGNTAELAGSALYGGRIDDCYTHASFVNRHGKASHYFSAEVFNETFQGFRPGQISSQPIKLHFCGESEYLLNSGTVKSVVPGQKFNVSVVSVGQRFGPTPAVIFADLAVEHCQNSTITHTEPALWNPTSKCTNLTMVLQTALVGSDIDVVLKMQRACPFSQQNGTSFTVSVQPCPWGFVLNTETGGKCECSDFHNFNYQCDLESLSLTIDHDHGRLDWIGCENLTNCANEPILYARGCGRAEYCNIVHHDITLNNMAQICTNNRTGILCGACAVGESVVFGTGRCKSCPPSNKYLSLVILYLAAGILLVLVITKLRLTISRGSLNGFIFYANFVHWNRDAFFPKFYNADVLRVIIAWLNLDLGIEVCFFNRMTALHMIWLQIGYILYIVSLQIAIILLCRRYVIFTRFFGRNVTKVLSTLVTLLYAKALTTVTSALAYTDIKNSRFPNHTFKKVLSVDGNIGFNSRQHIPLFIVALCLAAILLLFMFSLLFIQLLMQISSWRCFNWVARLLPFFETFTGSCNFGYAFWPGYLFFIRTVFLLTQMHFHQFNSSVAYAYQAGIIGIFTIIISFLGPKGVYRKWSLNLLELSLILNLTVTSFSVVSSKKEPTKVSISSHISVALALLQFLIYHIGSHTRCMRSIRSNVYSFYKTLVERYSQRKLQDTVSAVTHTDVTINTCERTPLLSAAQGMHPPVIYEEFREPLIED